MKSRTTQQQIASDRTPWEIARGLAHLPDLVFFDSALPLPGAISVIAARPDEVVEGKSEADWQLFASKLAARRGNSALDDGLPRGMAAGFVEYDGRFRFGFYEETLIFSHAAGEWFERGDLSPEIAELPAPAAAPVLDFQPELSRARFCEMVSRAQEYIAAGDIYQVNISGRFSARWPESADAIAFYDRLRDVSPKPYAGLLVSPERIICSASPEQFLSMSGPRIQTRPIKGTRPRFRDPQADERSALELLTSQKEIAELVMITDLERNDLGQVCEFGSVRVSELLKLERYEQVFHLVSTVDGQLRTGVDHVEALRACFPGGSITGAPKKRAREIISELEPAPRGLYTGAIGFFGYNGESRFNIAIRTAILDRAEKRIHFHAGAGIVADSVPEKEYQETLDKAAGILLSATGAL